MNIVPASDSSLLVVLGDAVSLDNHERVMSLFLALQRLNDPRMRNLHPAYASVLIDFDPLRMSHEEATTPPAGPERMVRTGSCAVRSAVEIPPFDCMT